MPGQFQIPADLMKEFTTNLRKTGKNFTIGTRPVTIKVFQDALTRTIGTPAAMEKLANQALKRAELKVR